MRRKTSETGDGVANVTVHIKNIRLHDPCGATRWKQATALLMWRKTFETGDRVANMAGNIKNG